MIIQFKNLSIRHIQYIRTKMLQYLCTIFVLNDKLYSVLLNVLSNKILIGCQFGCNVDTFKKIWYKREFRIWNV